MVHASYCGVLRHIGTALLIGFFFSVFGDAGAAERKDFFTKGAELAAEGKRDEAVAHFKAIATQKPDDLDAQIGYIQAMTNALRNDEVRREYESRMAAHPNEGSAYLFYFLTLSNPNDADAVIANGLRAEPSNQGLITAKMIADAYRLVAEGKEDEALRMTGNLPSTRLAALIHLVRAQALLQRGRLEESRRESDACRQALPFDPDCLVELASASSQEAEFPSALRSIEIAQGIQDSAAIRRWKLSLLTIMGKPEHVKEANERLLALAPQRADDFIARGEALWALGRRSEALKEFYEAGRRSLDVESKSAVILAEAKIYGPKKAREHADKLLKINPHDPALLLVSGALHAEECECKEALRDFDQILAITPKHVDTLNWKGYTLYRDNRSTEAISDLETAISLAPDYFALYNTLGDAYSAANRPDKARIAFQHAASLAPEYPQPYQELGFLELQAGATTQAAPYLAKAREYSYGDDLKDLDAAIAARMNGPAAPPAVVRGLMDSVPLSVTHLASVGGGARVLLFYDQGSIFSSRPGVDATPARNSLVQIWNGAAWDEPRPFNHVSDAVNVRGEFWALTNGGYLTSKDGAAWSSLNRQSDWKEPFACVLDGRPHVFYFNEGALKETVFDGANWSSPRIVPGDWDERPKGYPFSSPPQCNAIGGRVHLFALRNGDRTSQLIDFSEESGAGSSNAIGPAMAFRILDAPEGAHLFYRDMTLPEMEKPTIWKMFSMMPKMQSMAVRMSHRLNDGHAWSEPESVVTGQAFALSTARTDDALWLFSSAMSAVHLTVRRGGHWSSPKTVPGTTNTPSRSRLFYLRAFGLWAIFAIPMMLVMTLVIWGVSAAIESVKPTALDLGGRRILCASLLRRAWAQFVDGMLFWVLQMAAMFSFSATGAFDPASLTATFADHFLSIWLASMLATTAVYTTYFAVCEGLWGRTLGKRVLGIRVIAEDGSPCSGHGAAIRNVLRIADFFPVFLIGVGAFALGKKHQRVGDMAAGTLVVLDAKTP